MKSESRFFLEALKASLNGEKVNWNCEMSPQAWLGLFRLASEHQVLPMIYDAVYASAAAQLSPPEVLLPFKKQMLQLVMMQTIKTSEFLRLFQHLREAGLHPLVVKGIVCRNLYPNPDYRMSSDEDVLIPPEEFAHCHQVMLEYGMQLSNPESNLEKDYEVPYGKPGSPLYIELHKSLFPPESEAYGEFNRFFVQAHQHCVDIPIDGVLVTTMDDTDHLFYLICHAFKHFLHSGFGIRQVCDIVMFANVYGSRVDWLRLLQQCQAIHADVFTAALYQIGFKYLNFSPEKACYPKEWKAISVDETAMLMDLLSSGVYGGSDMSRKHSSNITLSAVAAQKQGKKAKGSLLQTVFPSAKSLEGRYPYLSKCPLLLPVAWADRILKYQKETVNTENNHASESIKIGNQRVELMREYKIIP
ncbi:MAG: nucleotidyltransferase family protein [Lachnospiraceae bacterium]